MNKIELINRHAEMVGGIKTSFALQDDMVESNIFLPHLEEVRVCECEDASNTDRANLTGETRPSEYWSNVIMPTLCTLTKVVLRYGRTQATRLTTNGLPQMTWSSATKHSLSHTFLASSGSRPPFFESTANSAA
jgi:hypothetical protein